MTTPNTKTSLIKFFMTSNQCANHYIWKIWNAEDNEILCEDYRDLPTGSPLDDRSVLFYSLTTKPLNNIYPFEEMQTIINVYVGGKI